MPSSRRDGSEGKWVCPPFLTQARQPRHRFSVGLKGCQQQHLSPKPFIKKKQQLKWYYKNRSVFNYRFTGYSITNGVDVR